MEIVKIEPENYGLKEDKATELIGNLPQIQEERKVLEAQYSEVIKMDIEAPETSVEARALRLLIRKNRTQGIGVWHKTTKDFFLKGGQFVDAIKNREVAVNERMESQLSEIENHYAILEENRLKELQAERVKQLSKYVEDSEERDLSSMECDVWEAYFQTKKKAYEDRLAAEKKAEEERQEALRLEALKSERENELRSYWQFVPETHPSFETLELSEWSDFLEEMKLSKEKYDTEQERIRKENERLQKEAESKKKEIAKRNEELKPYIVFIRDYNSLLESSNSDYKKQLDEIKIGAEQHWQHEREEQKRKLDEEDKRKAKEAAEALRAQKLETELQAKKDAEIKARKEAEALRQTELNKGDSEKVNDLEKDLEELKVKYSFKSVKNKKMYTDVGLLLDKVIKHINN